MALVFACAAVAALLVRRTRRRGQQPWRAIIGHAHCDDTTQRSELDAAFRKIAGSLLIGPTAHTHLLDTAPRTDRGPLQPSSAIVHYTSDAAASGAANIALNFPAMEWTEWDVLFPEPHEATAAFSPNADAVGNADAPYHCYLVHFSIKPEHCAEFERVLMQECRTVKRLEPGMVRYDLLRQRDDPTQFLVYEICASDAAMEVHEGRRANDKPCMRTVLGAMESVSRKLLPHTGRYLVREPSTAAGTRIVYSKSWARV